MPRLLYGNWGSQQSSGGESGPPYDETKYEDMTAHYHTTLVWMFVIVLFVGAFPHPVIFIGPALVCFINMCKSIWTLKGQVCRGAFVSEGDTRFDDHLERVKGRFIHDYTFFCLIYIPVVILLVLPCGFLASEICFPDRPAPQASHGPKAPVYQKPMPEASSE